MEDSSDSDSSLNENKARRVLRKYFLKTSISHPRISIAPKPKKMKKQSPQENVDEFWTKFNSKTPGKASTLLPVDSYAKKISDAVPKGSVIGECASASYEDAVRICKLKVDKIVTECRRVNQKYRDPHFDIEFDLKWGTMDCLETLAIPNRKKTIFKPGSVKRVGDIFEKPQFYIGKPSAKDIRQGQDGDCWLLAALCTLTNKPGLIERICVARHEQVGVYGFVFYRDSEWRSEIIDDKLYLTRPDYDESVLERVLWEDRERLHSEDEYRKAYQTGSGALYFAQCEDPNETWLPLLEKAYAKAHGDFAAIEGGFTGEGIEDLTGGVTCELFATDILDKEDFWKNELLKVNEEFLFGCATGVFKGWGERKGIKEGHAYSIMRAVDIDGHRLCLLKNPWGKGEWTGAWSDGSKEWTPEWMVKLNHRFGNDGAFWISYEDLLKKYQTFDRTRLFDESWKVTHQWATLRIPWTVDYHDTKFAFTINKPASVVLVLNQLNTRYFKGLAGQYFYDLSFRVHKSGEDDYIIRSRGNYCMRRSVTAEIDLEEAGEYSVLVKITAIRDYSSLPVETVIRDNCKNRRDKLLRIGLAYDLAHAKGQLEETADEREKREKAEARQKAKELAEVKQKMIQEKKKLRKSLKKKAKREKAKADKAARKLAKRASKTAQKMMAGNKNQQLDGGQGSQDNAVAGAGISRPGEPDNARNQVVDDCAECQAQQALDTQNAKNTQQEDRDQKQADDTKPEDNDNGDGSDRNDDSSSSNSNGNNTSKHTPQEDPAKDDIAGQLSKNVTFGDPQNNHMPCGFPESSRPSTCDIGGSNDVTGQNSPSSSRSRRSSQNQQQEGGRRRQPSEGPPAEANSDTNAMSSSTILDFVQPTYRPGVHGRRRTSLVDVPLNILDEAPGLAPQPQPLQAEEYDSDTDSDVSSVCSSAVEEMLIKSKQPPAPEPPKTEEQKKKEEEEEDEFEKDPWNAVCVVGLRVYAKALVREEGEDGKIHWHKDNGCACEKEDDVEKSVEDLKNEIEAKDVWTPATEPEDEKKGICHSPDDISEICERIREHGDSHGSEDKKSEHGSQHGLRHDSQDASECGFQHGSETKHDSFDEKEKPDDAAKAEKRMRRVTIKREEEPVEVTIRVVRPNSWEDGEASLDVDDSAMDATKGESCGDGKGGRKESVMGIRGRLGSVIVKHD